jgi:NTE family protein
MSATDQIFKSIVERGSHEPKKVEAYAVLAGGGVKGAALVGGLQAADDLGIEFVGYGGASAGSLVALLASLRYPLEKLRQIIVETDFTDFLDDGGDNLERLKSMSFSRLVRRPWSAIGDSKLLNALFNKLGLYEGEKLRQFILGKIVEQYPQLGDVAQITFNHLAQRQCKPLKIIVSDICNRKAIVYSAANGEFAATDDEIDDSVVHAVRASISYPFVFKPVKLGERYLVDGGLSSNLPVFLFARERVQTNRPIIAFDLIASREAQVSNYKMRNFGGDLMATALEASDSLHRKTIVDYISNVYYVPIGVPPGIDTLDFSLSKEKRELLFLRGYHDTMKHLRLALRNLTTVEPGVKKESVQALLNLPQYLVQAPLKAFAREIQDITGAANLRAKVMLVVGETKFVTAYHYGMDNDADRDAEFNIESGWAGRVFSTRKPFIIDLDKLRVDPRKLKLTEEQMRRVDPKRKAVLSVPIFELRERALEAQNVDELDCLGVLTIDTTTLLEDTSWLEGANFPVVIGVAKKWADVVSKLLD